MAFFEFGSGKALELGIAVAGRVVAEEADEAMDGA
jgi:hypothetical protein